MKSILFIMFYVLVVFNFNKARAAFSTSAIPIVNNEGWKNLKAVEFVKLSVKDFSKLSGKKLSLKEKISFLVLKKEIKKEIKKHPNFTVGEYLSHKKKLGTGWIILISAVGAFLLLILVAFLSGAGDIGL